MKPPIEQWARELRSIAEKLRVEAAGQESCCHGSDAEDALDEASEECLVLARQLESFALDQARAELRSAP